MRHFRSIALGLILSNGIVAFGAGFEGRIQIVTIRGDETDTLLYTIGADSLRIEATGSDRVQAINILDVKSGAITLVFPHNKTFVRLKEGRTHTPSSRLVGTTASAAPFVGDASPASTHLPPGIGPRSVGSGIGPTSNLPASLPPGVPAIPEFPQPSAGLPPGIGPQPVGAGATPGVPAISMPRMPMPGERPELQKTTNTMTIHGFPCVRYDLKQRRETMEIWATDKLLPYERYLRDQPARFEPQGLEEQWPELLKARKLFPLLISLKSDRGTEHFRFEVKSITPDRISADEKLFQPPSDYHELQPLPF